MSKSSSRIERRRLAATRRTTPDREFQPDYAYVRADLRRIAVLAVGLLGLLIVLAFVLS